MEMLRHIFYPWMLHWYQWDVYVTLRMLWYKLKWKWHELRDTNARDFSCINREVINPHRNFKSCFVSIQPAFVLLITIKKKLWYLGYFSLNPIKQKGAGFIDVLNLSFLSNYSSTTANKWYKFANYIFTETCIDFSVFLAFLSERYSMNNQQYDVDMMVLFKVYVLNDCCHVLLL